MYLTELQHKSIDLTAYKAFNGILHSTTTKIAARDLNYAECIQNRSQRGLPSCEFGCSASIVATRITAAYAYLYEANQQANAFINNRANWLKAFRSDGRVDHPILNSGCSTERQKGCTRTCYSATSLPSAMEKKAT
jgi:hypothetical protein